MIRVSLFAVVMLVTIEGCRKNNHQVVGLRNNSDQTVYVLISASNPLRDANEVRAIRPVVGNMKLDSGSAQSLPRYVLDKLYRYRVQPDSVIRLLSSESNEAFVDAITVKQIIRDRFKGTVYVYTISEKDLAEFSDADIISDNRYSLLVRLQETDINRDSIMLQYP